MVSDALRGDVNRVILLTADSDQIPAVKFLSTLQTVKVTLIYPPGRASHARDLGDQVPDRRELTVGRLLTCLLPRTVYDEGGRAVAFMPAVYGS